jgi:hypothetical protein
VGGCSRVVDSAGTRRVGGAAQEGRVEFLNFVLMFVVALLVASKRNRERLAFRLLVVSVLLMVALFSMATRTALLPGVNY